MTTSKPGRLSLPSRLQSGAIAALIGASVLLPAGCRIGGGDFANENDRLRRENLDLRGRVEQLDTQVDRLDTALQIAERDRTSELDALPDGVTRPVCAEIRIGQFSGGIDTNDDDRDDAVRLYLETFDARGRFIQAIGPVRVTVVATHAGAPAMTLATHTVDAATFDQSYRSSSAGTHYTLKCDLTQPAPAGTDRVTVHVALTDLLTGHEHLTEAIVRFAGPAD